MAHLVRLARRERARLRVDVRREGALDVVALRLALNGALREALQVVLKSAQEVLLRVLARCDFE